jgi:hypothetical protein
MDMSNFFVGASDEDLVADSQLSPEPVSPETVSPEQSEDDLFDPDDFGKPNNLDIEIEPFHVGGNETMYNLIEGTTSDFEPDDSDYKDEVVVSENKESMDEFFEKGQSKDFRIRLHQILANVLN